MKYTCHNRGYMCVPFVLILQSMAFGGLHIKVTDRGAHFQISIFPKCQWHDFSVNIKKSKMSLISEFQSQCQMSKFQNDQCQNLK